LRAIVEPELSRCFSHAVQNLATLHSTALLKVDEVLQANPAVMVRFLKADSALFEELNQCGGG
jgi:hypothetical protein